MMNKGRKNVLKEKMQILIAIPPKSWSKPSALIIILDSCFGKYLDLPKDNNTRFQMKVAYDLLKHRNMNNLERGWMYERLDNRGALYSSFVTGVNEFIQFACSQQNRMSGDKVRCLCAKCQNYKFMDVEIVKCHLYQFGFVENYFIWKHQGEKDVISGTSYGNDLHDGGQPVFGENSYRQMILDAAGPNFSQGSSWQSYRNVEPGPSHPFEHSMEEDPNPVSKFFFDLLDAADAELYLY
ncbi:hypothetical protein CQW23_27923 [Capsicum baccatum]|uniref:Transposase-associated domain-containing protein n=1 Tax=Capsicum baccatum TaxID=33114 RepID=A0A2G2VF47_CAPBA|nr:hypothetical protein CQW23_27923 [Capsicum baccatum]